MKEVNSTQDLEPEMMVKTGGNQIVEVYTVRHFNDTVTIGQSRKFPIIVSIDEIKEIVGEA